MPPFGPETEGSGWQPAYETTPNYKLRKRPVGLKQTVRRNEQLSSVKTREPLVVRNQGNQDERIRSGVRSLVGGNKSSMSTARLGIYRCCPRLYPFSERLLTLVYRQTLKRKREFGVT